MSNTPKIQLASPSTSRSGHLVELAWISESQEPLSQGGVLPSVSSDELVQSLMGEGGEAHGWRFHHVPNGMSQNWDGRCEAQNVVDIFCVCNLHWFDFFVWRNVVSFFGVEVGKSLILFSGATFHQIEVADCPKRRSAAMPFRAGQRS